MKSYANFRTDKEAKKGYSKELISNEYKGDPDNISLVPFEGCESIYDAFLKHCASQGNNPFLGQRQKTGKQQYEFNSFNKVREEAEAFARGSVELNLCSKMHADDTDWSFLGIQSKNRIEWTTILLGSMT